MERPEKAKRKKESEPASRTTYTIASEIKSRIFSDDHGATMWTSVTSQFVPINPKQPRFLNAHKY